MKNRILLILLALLLAVPVFADYVSTSCGDTVDLPKYWEEMTPREQDIWLDDVSHLICGSGGSVWIEKGERPAPSTEPDN